MAEACVVRRGRGCREKLICGVSRSTYMVLAERKGLCPSGRGWRGMSTLAKDADWRNRGQGPAGTGKQKFRGATTLWGTGAGSGGWRLEISVFFMQTAGGGDTSVTSTQVQGWGGREVRHWGEET